MYCRAYPTSGVFVPFPCTAWSLSLRRAEGDIKALSDGELNGLIKGHGMGMAKVAELNHYPGPKHVMELVDDLKLSDEQRKRTQGIYETMHAIALSVGQSIIEKERILDDMFAHGKIKEDALEEITAEIGKLRGRLRAAHLRAHLHMKDILTEGQIEMYDALRGYYSDTSLDDRRQRHHGHN